MKDNIAIPGKNFETPKQINPYEAAYWSARGLQSLLGYSQWRRSEQAIERAVASRKASGNPPDHHFADAGKKNVPQPHWGLRYPLQK
jgi:DNA-damage-inducible protein D